MFSKSDTPAVPMGPREDFYDAAHKELDAMNGADKSATKDDGGKPMVYSLFLAYFPRAIREVAKVSEYGMKKYNAKPETQGFRKVLDAKRRYADGLVRHLLDEVTDGPINEKDGGVRHAAQQAWNAMARLEIILEQEENSGGDNVRRLARVARRV